ncbi:NEL-type E3 ubiquitin ligase domain-containing protein [Pseudomonas triticicola]|uniref:NEL-type E3 ubiquitin ligase domain-containing protein n=1 Tax=Pseudomonas triticicola TaxID=2842345 RepID=UPI003EBB165A
MPAANAEGLRLFKGRQYIELADGGFMQVGQDSQSGLWRARLASEATPSGPVMLRDPEGGLWHSVADLQPTTFALSATRLKPFATALDLRTATRDSDGLHRHDGRLYAVIDNHGYQVLHDPDASTPWAQVMRIVRPDDAVAADSDNVYVATRPGRSEPIVFDSRAGWLGVEVGGVGGMNRAVNGSPERRSLRDRLSTLFNPRPTAQSRGRKLFPGLNDEDLGTLLRAQGDDVLDYLSRRESEYRTLKDDLAAWVSTSATEGNDKTGLVAAERSAKAIRRSWKRQTGNLLKLELGHGALPALSADFSYVHALELGAVNWSAAADDFLNGFTALERLTIARSNLDTLPASIANMPGLTELNLTTNRLLLTEQTAAQLSGLSQLQHLNLSHNPLGKAPDFSGLGSLRSVNLRGTQIEQWPNGLQDLQAPVIVDLRDNLLREIPQTILHPSSAQSLASARVNDVTLIEGNPFPTGYWRTLEKYWQRVSIEHPQAATGKQPKAFRLDGAAEDIAIVQRMYPDKDAQAAMDYLLGLEEGAPGEISRRFAEFSLLETQLEAYITDNQNGSSTATGPEAIKARRIARLIRGCWLGDSGGVLKLHEVYGHLPALTADFRQVKSLSLDAVSWSDAADAFLDRFPNLEQLTLTSCNIEKLPAIVTRLPLSSLDLRGNKIKLDQQSAAALSDLRALKHVDLSDNPLESIPDFSAMSGLQTLSLKNTGITEWPKGLLDKAALTTLDLRNNRLREVPQANLHPLPDDLPRVARINNGTRLEGNAFPSAYWRKFDGYWRRLKASHPDLMAPAHPAAFDSENSRAQRYRNLYPSKSIETCREFIWNHDKATLAPRLLALEQEFAVLKGQLDDWVFSGGHNRQRYIRANQLQLNAQTRSDRNEARDRILSCWRRATPQKRAFDNSEIGLELDLSGLTLPTLPDLSIDFSHVGSLKLNSMNLTESPEGFLTRFRHVRWLDMANNRLRDLPPAVGEMHGMTRLFLQGNQLELTAETAQILAGRTTLRALWMQDNPHLGVVPDFSLITDIREVDLSNTGIDRWPTGLFDQPQLGKITLSNNRITTLPDFVIAPAADRLAHSVQVNSGTRISNNPLTATTHEQLRIYSRRLSAAATPLHHRWNLLTTAVPIATHQTSEVPPLTLAPQWFSGMPADQAAARLAQMKALRAQPDSDGFFNIISGLTHHEDFRRQAWEVIDIISDNSPQTRALRREFFARACEAGCTDLAAATFTDLQVLAMTHKVRTQAREDGNGAPLVELSKGLFRLKQVDDIAVAEVAASRAIANDPLIPADERNRHNLRIRDPHEMTMAFRFGLKDRLKLPFQPKTLTFIGLADVTPAMLDVAYRKVIALDDSPEEVQALLSTDFWQDFITYKYSPQFDAARQPYQEKQAELSTQFSSKSLTQAQYDAQTDDLTAQLAISEATLIQALTRQELQPADVVEVPASEAAAQAN